MKHFLTPKYIVFSTFAFGCLYLFAIAFLSWDLERTNEVTVNIDSHTSHPTEDAASYKITKKEERWSVETFEIDNRETIILFDSLNERQSKERWVKGYKISLETPDPLTNARPIIVGEHKNPNIPTVYRSVRQELGPNGVIHTIHVPNDRFRTFKFGLSIFGPIKTELNSITITPMVYNKWYKASIAHSIFKNYSTPDLTQKLKNPLTAIIIMVFFLWLSSTIAFPIFKDKFAAFACSIPILYVAVGLSGQISYILRVNAFMLFTAISLIYLVRIAVAVRRRDALKLLLPLPTTYGFLVIILSMVILAPEIYRNAGFLDFGDTSWYTGASRQLLSKGQFLLNNFNGSYFYDIVDPTASSIQATHSYLSFIGLTNPNTIIYLLSYTSIAFITCVVYFMFRQVSYSTFVLLTSLTAYFMIDAANLVSLMWYAFGRIHAYVTGYLILGILAFSFIKENMKFNKTQLLAACILGGLSCIHLPRFLPIAICCGLLYIVLTLMSDATTKKKIINIATFASISISIAIFVSFEKIQAIFEIYSNEFNLSNAAKLKSNRSNPFKINLFYMILVSFSYFWLLVSYIDRFKKYSFLSDSKNKFTVGVIATFVSIYFVAHYLFTPNLPRRNFGELWGYIVPVIMMFTCLLFANIVCGLLDYLKKNKLNSFKNPLQCISAISLVSLLYFLVNLGPLSLKPYLDKLLDRSISRNQETNTYWVAHPHRPILEYLSDKEWPRIGGNPNSLGRLAGHANFKPSNFYFRSPPFPQITVLGYFPVLENFLMLHSSTIEELYIWSKRLQLDYILLESPYFKHTYSTMTGIDPEKNLSILEKDGLTAAISTVGATLYEPPERPQGLCDDTIPSILYRFRINPNSSQSSPVIHQISSNNGKSVDLIEIDSKQNNNFIYSFPHTFRNWGDIQQNEFGVGRILSVDLTSQHKRFRVNSYPFRVSYDPQQEIALKIKASSRGTNTLSVDVWNGREWEVLKKVNMKEARHFYEFNTKLANIDSFTFDALNFPSLKKCAKEPTDG